MKRLSLSCLIRYIAAWTTFFAAEYASAQPAPVEIGSRRELFVDRFLIDKLDNTRLKLHEPRSEGSVFNLDRPWEGQSSVYTTVIQDGDRLRMYYRGMSPDDRREFTCYAESPDGVTWTRPELGLVEWEGNARNNILLADLPECHAFAPFLDTRPGTPPEERYKALGPNFSLGALTAWASADGIHWRRLSEQPVISKEQMPFKYIHLFDSQNVPFWSDHERCYVCYFRVWDGLRRIARVTSDDFLTWKPAELMEQVCDEGTESKPAPDEHLYTNQTTPYYRAPHIYLALPSRFMDGEDAVSLENKARLGLHHSYVPVGSGFNDAPLMTTRGGNRYDCTFLEAFIRPGVGLKNWTSRANYPACGITPCVDDPTRVAIYVNRQVGYPSAHIERLTLRADGFISVNAPYAGGELVTKPLLFAGKALAINYSTSAAGSVRVEIQDAQGQPIPGFTLADSPKVIGDEIERVVTWKAGDAANSDVSKLAGQAIRLRFAMKDADLYSLQFQE